MSSLEPLAPIVFPVLGAGSPLDHILPHPLYDFSWAHVGDYTITNHVVMLVLSALLLAVFLPFAARSRALVPSGFRSLIEAVLQFLREEVARPALGSATDRFMPFVWTMFFLILTANLLGMIPINAVGGSIDARLSHVAGTATGNFSITIGLAVLSVLLIQVSGFRYQGAGYLKTFLGHAPWWMFPLMIPLEILAALIKGFALAIRLFANMIAGHVVIAVLMGFAAWGLMQGGAFLGVTAASALGVIFISLLELLVAFLQAYIFTFLTVLFVGMAIHTDH